jgi:hypothetical protein
MRVKKYPANIGVVRQRLSTLTRILGTKVSNPASATHSAASRS